MLPTDAKKRKDIPIYSGFWCYFPDAIAAVAELSRLGNDQHNPGKDLFWDRSKSGDELDALARHLTDHAKGVVLDVDGVRHLTKNAWRSMAALQKALELAAKEAEFDEAMKNIPAAGPWKFPPADHKSRWLMCDELTGKEWETGSRYTYAEAVVCFKGTAPVLRLPEADVSTCDDIPRDHPVACPCYACAKQRRDASGQWE